MTTLHPSAPGRPGAEPDPFFTFDYVALDQPETAELLRVLLEDFYAVTVARSYHGAISAASMGQSSRFAPCTPP